jgi:DNA polymerase (family 10)
MLRFRGESSHRARAYEAGADAVENVAGDLDRLVAEDRLTNIPAIGRSLAATITELVRYGRSETIERIMRGHVPAPLLQLADVPGFTPRRIRILHEALGLETVDDVRAALISGAAAQVRGIGAATADKLRQALENEDRTPRRTLLFEAARWGQRLASHLRMAAPLDAVEVAGSVRRCVETVRDVNLVAATTRPEEVLDAFVGYAGVAAVLERRLGGCAVRLSDGLGATLLAVPPEAFGAALVAATGSSAHVQALERRARARDLALGDLRGAGESQIYEKLGLPVVPPELREAQGELEAADAGDSFADLVTYEDLRGAVHCHTVASDGRDTLGDMAVAAERLGLSYLTITDHSAAASYAGGLSAERLAAQGREIEALQRQIGVRLLRGAECDILKDGTLDYPDEVRDGLDVVIASIHERYRLDQSAMTARLVRALGDKRFKIWGHPLGRLLMHRQPIDCDLEQVLGALASAPGAVEINGSPWRLDLPAALIPRARLRGLKFVISADAHAVSELGYLRWGVAVARRGGLRRGDVLNTLPADAFAATMCGRKPAAGPR